MAVNNPIIAIAPMLDWTDKHCRYFYRLLAKKIVLYTEMLTTGAIIHGDSKKLLAYHSLEHPLVAQVAGSDSKDLEVCAKILENAAFDQINFNVGCPSARVQAGKFGACLFLEPNLVADCMAAMQQVVNIPVTIKMRLGCDQHDSYEEITNFIKKIAAVGCKTFIIHARKALLSGVSAKENRTIPKLNYAFVHKIKQDFPNLTIIINGGLCSWQQVKEQLIDLDGVMLGRAIYHNPYLLAEVDQVFFAESKRILSRKEILEQFYPYIEKQLAYGVNLAKITRHIISLFHGCSNAKAWRQYLTEHAHLPNASVEVIKQAASLIETI